MKILMFTSILLFTLAVVSIAMLYLRHTTRQVIAELCKSDAGAEFWLRSSDILAYSGALMLVLIFGNTTSNQDLVDVLRVTLILTLGGIFVTVMFVARNVWRTVAPQTVNQKPQASS